MAFPIASPSSPQAIKQMNDELNTLLQHLKENNKFTENDLRKIFAPLNSNTRKKQLLLVTILSFILTAGLIYLATYIETVSWHSSAIARILMIKLLPLYDWTTLKNEHCIISKSWRENEVMTVGNNFNCELCQDVASVDFYANYRDIDEDFLKKRYLDVHLPVIVNNTLTKWIQGYDNILSELSQDGALLSSTPCHLSTNLYNGITSLDVIFDRINLFGDRFFLHFQNCELAAMKAFRKYTPRPPVVPTEISPSQYNWLILSKNYTQSIFRKIEGLVERIAILGQISGSHYVNLLPRNNCQEECREMALKINAGEALIFTSLWDIEYKGGDDFNLAAIVEYR